MKLNKTIIQILKREKQFELKTSNRHEIAIYNCYLTLYTEINKQFSKSGVEDFKSSIKKIIENKFSEQLKLTLNKIAEINISQFTKYFIDRFKLTLSLDELKSIKSKLLEKFLRKYTGFTVTNVSDTTKKIINARITDYTSKGINFNDMVKKIMEDTKIIGKTRAKIIARTETSKAIAETNNSISSSAGFKFKTWAHLGGGVTNRTNHLEMEGVTIKINEKFKVPELGKTPSAMMRFPKDPECRVAGQIVNCYCGVWYS